MVKEGVPYLMTILAFFLLASVALLTFGWSPLLPVAALLILLGAGLMIFFRDPRRSVPKGEGLIVSPADGRIVEVSEAVDADHGTALRKIGIFLSLWDVHVNRCPMTGRVEEVEHRAGRFTPAFRSKASHSNEQMHIRLSTEAGTVRMTQIAGSLARRIICRLRPGDQVTRGERFGMILFGSRVEVYLPVGVTVRVSVGDRLKGGESIIGAFQHHV